MRVLAKARRAGDSAAQAGLVAALDGLDPAALRVLVKAFSSFFQLTNIAEDQQRPARPARARSGRRPGRVDWRGGGGPQGRRLDAAQVRALLDRLRVRLVLNAHPSEAKRKEVLVKLRHIAHLLAARDREPLLPREQRALEASLAETIEELWQTRPTRAASPSVLDEVDFGLYFLTSVIMDAVVDINDDLRGALGEAYPEADWHDLPPVLTYASWIGGDRDGNPNVTPSATLRTLEHQAAAVRRVYLAELAFLRAT